jgi:hypothetical protein
VFDSSGKGAPDVAKERLITHCRVIVAFCIPVERLRTGSRVEVALDPTANDAGADVGDQNREILAVLS